MWKTLSTPVRILTILTRIALLLEENNSLLRELILKATGHNALTAKRSAGVPTASLPKMGHDGTPGPQRTVRSGSDVWQRTPLTEMELIARENRSREQSAEQPREVETQEKVFRSGENEPPPIGSGMIGALIDWPPRP